MTRIILLVAALLVAFFIISAFVHFLLYLTIPLLLVALVGFSLFKVGRWSGGRSQRQPRQ